jgi:hypothetical protein
MLSVPLVQQDESSSSANSDSASVSVNVSDVFIIQEVQHDHHSNNYDSGGHYPRSNRQCAMVLILIAHYALSGLVPWLLVRYSSPPDGLGVAFLAWLYLAPLGLILTPHAISATLLVHFNMHHELPRLAAGLFALYSLTGFLLYDYVARARLYCTTLSPGPCLPPTMIAVAHGAVMFWMFVFMTPFVVMRVGVIEYSRPAIVSCCSVVRLLLKCVFACVRVPIVVLYTNW